MDSRYNANNNNSISTFGSSVPKFSNKQPFTGKHTPPPPPSSSTTTNSSASLLVNPPAMIAWRNMKFLIMDAPSESNLHVYLDEMQKQKVKHLVRVCEPTYSKTAVEALGIKLHDWLFPDGEGPPDDIIDAWLKLVASTFSAESNENMPCIACHCVAGLGR